MIYLKRTNSEDMLFQELVRKLDLELSVLDTEDHSFYDQFNKVSGIRYAVVAYEQNIPVGCGAIKSIQPIPLRLNECSCRCTKGGRALLLLY